MASSDLLLLGFTAMALLGYENSKKNIYKILYWADNSGSIDNATGQNSQYSMPNQDPNFRGSNALIKANNELAPSPPPHWHALEGEYAAHPAPASKLVSNFGIN